MDEELERRIEREVEIHALLNALKHEGDAQVGAIMGPLMGENPSFREHGEEIPAIAAPVIDRVNALDTAEKRARLAEIAPDRLDALEEEPETDDHPLPDLPRVEEYDDVRMRVAPNPNGPWHLGHARMPAVIGTYKDIYDGSFICRFDDTDPETKRPDLDAYDQILSDIEYLGFEPDDVIRASDRLETYYDHGRRLIQSGGAYTCSCDAEAFSEMKNAGEACEHRSKDVETVRSEFEQMIDGEYDEGEMVLRVKTDIEHKNPALRDWVAFRIVERAHPRSDAASYRCWPMLDFQSGIDDHLTGVTHIIRGIDLQDSAKRQQFVYDYFGWSYPEVIHWGHVQVDEYDVRMSTSRIASLIESGDLDGWDDPRAPTLLSLRRRGIRGSAIVDAMVELGTSTSNVELSMSAIYANNRELIDDETDRQFLVRERVDTGSLTADETGPAIGDPSGIGAVQLSIQDGPESANPPIHPDHEDRGTRDIPVGDSVLLESSDLPPAGSRVWLKGFGCVRYDGSVLVYTDDDIEVVREGTVDVVQWVPAENNVPVQLRTPTGDVYGRAEPGFSSYEPDDVVQFVRVGFARVDEVSENGVIAFYAHP
ncbi:MAG: glutamate--tRNA ligase [Halodesulfurarchaeum sp.]